MSSVQATIAQRPTKKFTVTPVKFAQDGTTPFAVTFSAPKIYTQEALVALIAAANASYQSVGSVYLVNTMANLAAFIGAADAAGSSLNIGESLTDMGAQFSVGLQGGESKIITFRKVKRSNAVLAASLDDGNHGYVVTENVLSQCAETVNSVALLSLLEVGVARV